MDIDFLREVEGFREKAYQCIADVWTVGTGFTRIDNVPVKRGDTITKEKDEILLKKAFKSFEASAVKEWSGFAELNDNQKTALYSFAHNHGYDTLFNKATIWRMLKDGSYKGRTLADKSNPFYEKWTAYSKFTNPVSKQLEFSPGLFNRKVKEFRLFWQ